MRNRYKMLRPAFLAICILLGNPASANREKSTQLAIEAKEVLDAHFGSSERLAQAAALLKRALAEDESDPAIYVQAARLTVKGGHVVASRFRPGTLDAYGELLDRALSLDPKNPKAHILKAEYFHFKGDYASERFELDKAKETGTTDSWLLIGYGRHYWKMRAGDQAFSSYSAARARGPGASLEQRNAYIASLNKLAGIAAGVDDRKTLKELTDLTRKERDPRDAWALGNLAESLVGASMFDDAIAISREGLSVMNYGAGRLTLATALYGKAAEVTAAGKKDAAATLLQEARSYGFSRSSVLGRFACCSGPRVTQLLPTLDALVE
jgi:tetratricopeptide (TPR) repeat protein